jgi:hypothetical protein
VLAISFILFSRNLPDVPPRSLKLFKPSKPGCKQNETVSFWLDATPRVG